LRFCCALEKLDVALVKLPCSAAIYFGGKGIGRA
jgi:hypothetical protein